MKSPEFLHPYQPLVPEPPRRPSRLLCYVLGVAAAAITFYLFNL